MTENPTAASPERARPADERSDRRSPLRLPVLSGGEDRGLGDVVKRATTALHVRPCGGCERRAQALNRWVVLTPRGPRT